MKKTCLKIVAVLCSLMFVTSFLSAAENEQHSASAAAEAVQADESAPVSANTDEAMSDQKNVPADTSGVSDGNGDDVPEWSPNTHCSKVSGAEAVTTASWAEVKQKYRDF